MKRIQYGFAAVLLAGSAAAGAADAPLWEVGLGVGAVSFPDYRGSDRQRVHAVPVPYVVYRGEFLKADREGVRGVFFDSDRVEINVSLGASVPVDSDGNDARRGMPDLDPTVEIGPSVDVTLWRSAGQRAKLDLRLPLRWATTVSGEFRDVGMVFSPRINLDVRDPFGYSGWNLGLLTGPIYADERNHAYFYDVAPRYATATRPAYEADGGYSGTQFIGALSKRYPGYWVGAFVRYDTLSGAAFEDSPLVKRDNAWAAGFGIAWMLGQSSQRVPIDD
ncbi:MipA/OmpV family protein [Nitrogeniibacter aestuarii]|uniref:MipA/OmpV family protein n=1 Tax=Nitrogeniibacter aestuarii TaxID=2815343 RepID=UPI001E579C0C|nr:MipA/OmpV family protein [Nitrogeniibacter aestuarii]